LPMEQEIRGAEVSRMINLLEVPKQ